MRKPDFCLGENKGADQLRGKLISAFVFATRIVYFLFFLYPKFQASSLLLRLYSPVCVGPCRKSRRPVFSRRGSYDDIDVLVSVPIDTATCTTKLWYIRYIRGISFLPLDETTYLQVQCFINLLGCVLCYYNVTFFLSVLIDTTSAKLWYI